MANVPGLNIGGTGTTATQSAGAFPVVGAGGNILAFSAVGTSGHFVRSGGTGVPTFLNLFGTVNNWSVRQEFGAGADALRVKSNGLGDDRAYISFFSDTVTPTVRSGNVGFSVANLAALHLFNEKDGGPVTIRTTGGNYYFQHSNFTPGAGGAASGVIAMQNAATAPTANPVGGAFLWVEAGAWKARGTSGTVTTVATANPHCPTCGRDYVLEWENENGWGHFALCLPCLIDELAERVPSFNRARSQVPKAQPGGGRP